MHITLWQSLMNAACPSSWYQRSKLLCSIRQLVVPVCMPVLCASFQMCLFSVSAGWITGSDSHTAGGPQQARAQTPGTWADLLLLWAHCKHSRGAEGGSSPWTRERTQTLFKQASRKSPSWVHKPLSQLAEILLHDFLKTKIMSGLSVGHIKTKLIILMQHFKGTVRHFGKWLLLYFTCWKFDEKINTTLVSFKSIQGYDKDWKQITLLCSK